MGRARKSDSEKRNNYVEIGFNDAEYAELKKRSEGGKIARFVRQAALRDDALQIISHKNCEVARKIRTLNELIKKIYLLRRGEINKINQIINDELENTCRKNASQAHSRNTLSNEHRHCESENDIITDSESISDSSEIFRRFALYNKMSETEADLYREIGENLRKINQELLTDADDHD